MSAAKRKIRASGADTRPMRDEGDRFVAWRLDDTLATPGADLEEERMERALLAYAHRSATRVGAEWFAAEFARRDEEERVQIERAAEVADEPAPDPSREITLVDASVEDAVVGGAPTSLGLPPLQQPEPVEPDPTPQPVSITVEPPPPSTDLVPEPALQPAAFVGEPISEPPVLEVEPTPEPAIRHPHVPRPPAPQPTPEKKRRRHRKQVEVPTPSFVISAPEWARMSPGARRLYGLDAAPPAAATG